MYQSLSSPSAYAAVCIYIYIYICFFLFFIYFFNLTCLQFVVGGSVFYSKFHLLHTLEHLGVARSVTVLHAPAGIQVAHAATLSLVAVCCGHYFAALDFELSGMLGFPYRGIGAKEGTSA